MGVRGCARVPHRLKNGIYKCLYVGGQSSPDKLVMWGQSSPHKPIMWGSGLP